jgi:hypothetical protein
MKHLKLAGLLAVAAAAPMAFAGSASATTVTSSEGSTPNIVLTSTNMEFDGSFVTYKCSDSKMEGNVESHGSSAPVEANIDLFSLTGCNYEMTINAGGSLIVHSDPTGSTGDGTVTWTGGNFTIHTSVGACTITTNGTNIGTLDGRTEAFLELNSAKLPRTGGNFLCGSSITWTGKYTVTSPSALEVH